MLIASWWGALVGAIIQAEHRYRLLSINSVVTPFVLVGATVLLAGVLNLGLEGAIAARTFAVLLILGVLLYLLRASSKGTREPYPEERSAMMRMLLPMGVLAVSAAFAANFDRLFVRNFMVEDSAGLSAIFTLGQIPRMMLAPLGFVLLPIAAAQHASGRQLGHLLLRSVAISALLIATCCIGFALFATPVLNYWKPVFAPYGRYVWIYALMGGLQALGGIVAQVELARSRYSFLWFMAPPVPIACAAIYIAKDHFGIPISLDALLWTLTAAHALAFLATALFLRVIARGSELVQS
jgi:O-antigen/teichoic acid export membrane protein